MNKARGFSLLEVMVAAALLGIGLAATLSGMSSSREFIVHQRHLSQGIHVAEAVMETQLVKVSSHTDLSVGSHTGDNYDDLGRVSATGRFRSSWVVANTPAPIANMRRVTVRVEWDENTGTKAVVLTSVRN